MAKKNNKVDKRTSNIPVGKNNKKQAPAENNVLTYKDGMTVAEVASGMGKTNAQIIMKLMQAATSATVILFLYVKTLFSFSTACFFPPLKLGMLAVLLSCLLFFLAIKSPYFFNIFKKPGFVMPITIRFSLPIVCDNSLPV